LKDRALETLDSTFLLLAVSINLTPTIVHVALFYI